MAPGSVNAAFIELPAFSRAMDTERLDDDWLADLQSDLLEGRGHVYRPRQLGGFFKIRAPDPRRGKGKSGGYRVDYMPYPDLEIIVLAFLSSKDVEANITPAMQARLRRLAPELRREVERYVRQKRRT